MVAHEYQTFFGGIFKIFAFDTLLRSIFLLINLFSFFVYRHIIFLQEQPHRNEIFFVMKKKLHDL